MRLMITFIFGTLLLLNSISQIVGLPGFYQFDDSGIDDDLSTSARQINNEDYFKVQKEINAIQQELVNLIRHVQADDQLTVLGIVLLTLKNEQHACTKYPERSKDFDKMYYNTVAEMYPMAQYQYDQLLKKSDEPDQIILKELIDKAKTTANYWCKFFSDTE